MYFFEALRNYKRVKAAYEAAREAAMDFSSIKKAIESSPAKAVSVGSGKYVLVDSMTFNEMLAADKAFQMSPETASDILISLIGNYGHIRGSVDTKEVRAVTMAIEAMSLTSPIEEAFEGTDIDIPQVSWLDSKLKKLDYAVSTDE